MDKLIKTGEKMIRKKVITIGLCFSLIVTTMAMTVTAKDIRSTPSSIIMGDNLKKPNTTHITDLFEGWNYISLPFEESITTDDLLVVFKGKVLSWEEALLEKIICQDPLTINKVTGAMEMTDFLQPGNGYMIKSQRDHITLLVNQVDLPESESMITPLPLAIWQLFGLPFSHEVTIGDLIFVYRGKEYNFKEAVKQGYVYGVIYNFNRETQRYEFLMDDDEILKPGYGYYIQTLQNSLILKI